jgi:hypothetical protein
MTQWEYDTIIMALEGGVPALAERLGLSLQNLVKERNDLAEENEELKSSKCDCSCEKAQSEVTEKAVKKLVTKKPE